MSKLIKFLSVATFVGLFSAVSVFGDGIEDAVRDTDGVTDVSETPTMTGSDKIILTVDQRGNLSSTNAIATAADLATVAASNALALAIQDANATGYQTATNLLNEVAASVASSPIVFCSAELTSFVAATVFDEATSKLRIFEWAVDQGVTATKTLVVNGVSTNVVCQRITCGYMFTSDIQSIQPLVRYVEHLENSGDPSTWNYLNADLVTSPTVVTHASYTDSAGTTFTNFYRIYIWIPADRATGFFRVVVENSVVAGDGSTLDTVGVVDGYTGTVTYGTIQLNIKGGYILATGTGQVSNE